MIFYHMQTHANFDYCRRLLSMIYSPDNYYYISIDTPSREDPSPLLDAAIRLDNVQIDHTKSVTYAGMSLLNAMVVALRCFADGPARYSWFINISGVDVPLAPQSRMMSRLEALSKKGVEACVHFHPATDMSQIQYHVQQKTPHEAPYIWQKRPDISFIVERGLASLFGDKLPFKDRFGVFLFDNTPHKEIIARPLLEIEALAREALFTKRRMRDGWAWHCLSRAWAQALFAHPDFPAVVAALSSLLAPEEMLIQTLATDSDDLDQDPSILRDNLRFRGGEPVSITDAFFDELFSSNALFARKFDPQYAPRLFAHCAAMCAREIDDFSGCAAAPQARPDALQKEAQRGEPLAACTFEPGRTYHFGEGGEGNAALEAGWGGPQPWHVWSVADYARITFRVPEHALAGASAIRCVFAVGAHISTWATMQRVNIVANGHRVYAGIMLGSSSPGLIFDVPRAVIPSNGTIMLEFHLPNAAPVETVDRKEVDGRRLAVVLYSVTLWQA